MPRELSFNGVRLLLARVRTTFYHSKGSRVKKDEPGVGPSTRPDPGAAEQTGRREALPLRITAGRTPEGRGDGLWEPAPAEGQETMELVYSESREREEAIGVPDRGPASKARGGDIGSFQAPRVRQPPALGPLARRSGGAAVGSR